jgi:putative cell wall-binding protein
VRRAGVPGELGIARPTCKPCDPMKRARPALVAVILLAAGLGLPPEPARAHPIAHPGPPRVRNLRPAFGEVTGPGPLTVAAQVVADVAIAAHTLTIDGVPVASTREGSDASHPTVVARVDLAPGDHVAELRVTGSDGRTGGRAWRFTVSGLPARRLAGAGRIDTAVAASRDLYPAATSAGGAVLARADQFADALAGAALAARADGPLLLTERDRLSPATEAELRRVVRPAGTVWLLGGPAALSQAVADAVTAAGFVPRRLAGGDRFATAAAVAAELGPAGTALVVSGTSFPDALAASAPSAAEGWPVLLVTRDAVPPATREALAASGAGRAVIVGGEAAVGPAVAGALASVVGEVGRVAGPDRYATSVAVARALLPGADTLVLASGETFPDALAGGRLAGGRRSPVVLAPARNLDLPRAEAIAALAPNALTVTGGPAALDDNVVAAVRAAALDAGAAVPDGADPSPGAELGTLDAFSVSFDRDLDVAASNVTVLLGDEEIPGSLAAGDFPDTLVFTVGELPWRPPPGEAVPVRLLVAAFDGQRWRHLDWRLTYRKLDLGRGDSGPAVLALQQRLTSLGYWLGTPDGSYGTLTAQAVLAFQKVEGLPRTGVYDAPTRSRLARATRPTPRVTSGDHIEVDKARQVLFVVRAGRLAWALNTSTGTERPYTYGGQTYVAHTPTGTFTISRQIDGVRESRLGTLYRPKYFTADGVAIHGSASVPAYPASHGCVRVTNAAMDWIWAENLAPLGSRVIVY